MRFIDLYAGLGGFHQALSALGHRCVFASEIDEGLAKLYEKNFGIRPHGDIRAVSVAAIPAHDILCAGFPCQPFSKAGEQKGLECPQWGDLFDYVIAILRARKPRFVIVENVPNLVRHNKGVTWRNILRRLRLAGYSVSDRLLSPHHIGVPQIRERAFIVGRRGGLNDFQWPQPDPSANLTIQSVLDEHPPEARRLPDHFVRYLEAWQEFLERFPKDEELPSFPIWAMEFGATYPYADRTPTKIGLRAIDCFEGSFGKSLRGLSEEAMKNGNCPSGVSAASVSHSTCTGPPKLSRLTPCGGPLSSTGGCSPAG